MPRRIGHPLRSNFRNDLRGVTHTYKNSVETCRMCNKLQFCFAVSLNEEK